MSGGKYLQVGPQSLILKNSVQVPFHLKEAYYQIH